MSERHGKFKYKDELLQIKAEDFRKVYDESCEDVKTVLRGLAPGYVEDEWEDVTGEIVWSISPSPKASLAGYFRLNGHHNGSALPVVIADGEGIKPVCLSFKVEYGGCWLFRILRKRS